MKTTLIISAMALLTSLFVVTACKDDEDDPTPTPSSYFSATIKYNSTAPQNYVSDEFDFDARVDSTGNDTLVFEGERSSDASYMYFNLITPDLYDFTAGDSITIPYDVASGTEVFCSLLIHSVSNEIFQPGGGTQQGKVYIDEIDYSKKYLKGRMYGTFYTQNDSLKVTDATFLIDL